MGFPKGVIRELLVRVDPLPSLATVSNGVVKTMRTFALTSVGARCPSVDVAVAPTVDQTSSLGWLVPAAGEIVLYDSSPFHYEFDVLQLRDIRSEERRVG